MLAPASLAKRLAGAGATHIVKKINNQAINSLRDYAGYLRRFKPGDKVVFTCLRNNKEFKTSVILKAR